MPLILKRCVDEVEKRGLDIVGIYRLCGSALRKKILRESFERNAWTVDLTAEHVPDINVITSKCLLHSRLEMDDDDTAVAAVVVVGHAASGPHRRRRRHRHRRCRCRCRCCRRCRNGVLNNGRPLSPVLTLVEIRPTPRRAPGSAVRVERFHWVFCCRPHQGLLARIARAAVHQRTFRHAGRRAVRVPARRSDRQRQTHVRHSGLSSESEPVNRAVPSRPSQADCGAQRHEQGMY